jgi:hypothetical protein
MFALILAVVFSGNSEDRMPEISLSFNITKVSIVRDSMKMVAPNRVTFDNMNKVGKTRQVEKPNPDLVVIMDNWN